MTNETDLKAPPGDEEEPITERERELAHARAMRVSAVHPHELFEDPQPGPLQPRVGPLKPLALCKVTGRPHRYVGPFDHCGDCGAPAPTE